LLAAIAAQRMKNIAGQALGMNAHQRRRRLHVPHHQGNRFFHSAVAIGAILRSKSIDPEFAPAGGKVRGCDLLY